MFVTVPDTLSLIRFRRSETTNLRRNLTDFLLIGAFDQDFSLAWCFHIHAAWNLIHDRMGEPEAQVELRPFSLSPITDTDNGQRLLETLGDTRDHIAQQ